MRCAPPLSIAIVASLVACTGEPVGEADASVDAIVDSGGPASDTRAEGDAAGSETRPAETATTDGADGGLDAKPLRTAGKACTKKSDCDPAGTTGADCLLQAPTPMCYGGKCSPKTVDPTISPCPDDGVCLDDGLGGGICVPLCYFDGTTGALVQGCLGKNACWYVSSADIEGKRHVYGRCEGRCGSDVDCPTGTRCQNDGACVAAPKAYPGAIGDACADTDDGVKCACVYDPGTKLGYCS